MSSKEKFNLIKTTLLFTFFPIAELHFDCIYLEVAYKLQDTKLAIMWCLSIKRKPLDLKPLVAWFDAICKSARIVCRS